MLPELTIVAGLMIASFILGLAIGWILTANSPSTSTEKLRIAISVVVTLLWVVTVAADIFITGYTVSPLMHAIMGAIVGYFFTDKEINIGITGRNR